ncbi:MAG: hypothetical protein HFJ17_03395 [Clostridia bacterium]|nr:hypothetical protein [Clostridia bacterium]
MSKLLHSKTFRGNLTKWLLLYILALLIVTGVVTYSKYISSMTSVDDARQAKFKVQIDKGDICSTTSPDLCNLTSYKPYDQLEYKFSVDTEKVEVLTDLVLNIKVNSDFEVISLNDINIPQNTSNKFTVTMSDNTKLSFEDNLFTLISEVGPNKIGKKQYILKLRFKDKSYKVEYNYNEIVNVGYSAIQKTK